ncbi:MAG: alanine dehydrogenase [Bacteriovoracaceae bacterium]|jgi:alanine dehydrogenase|nr:alanine dehydrogenase [Bacteriovoracaceae bacterium]
MNQQYSLIKTIALVKESESPENPNGLEKRVAMIPEDIKSLVDDGRTVFVEKGAGEGIGFSDSEYVAVGATLQSADEIYSNKDMIIKFKGPSLESVIKMTEGTILFCMAHFRSFQERAELLEKCKINVIAMEEILESPKFISDKIVESKRFVEETLTAQDIPYPELDIAFLGYDENMIGGIRRAGNRNSKSHSLFQVDVKLEELSHFGKRALYFYDSRNMKNERLIQELKSKDCQVYNLLDFDLTKASKAIVEYRASHPPFKFGGRRIQCLHETGMAGARYGFTLLNEAKKIKIIDACVLGYGNVGMGAIRECYDQGVRKIKILGRTQTKTENIPSYLKNTELIINGAEQVPELRGVNFLIKKDYVGACIKEGAVVIDLVGGSAVNRSPVEDIIECTYLTAPHFERDGVTFSALWGWPMMGMMKESAVKYSGQILEVLLKEENILKGLNHLVPAVKQALVCGPH